MFEMRKCIVEDAFYQLLNDVEMIFHQFAFVRQKFLIPC